MKAVLLFLDGVGVGADDPAINPMARVRGPVLSDFLEGAASDPPLGGRRARPDACLGVEGLPQSATGQTALFTGLNAPGLLGRHRFGFPNERLRQVLLRHSFLRRAAEAGRDARFLNAFRPAFFEREPFGAAEGLSASTVAHLASGRPFFDLDALRAGRCLYQDFTNAHLRRLGFDVPLRTPAEAGEIFARTAAEHDVVLYEYFQTDRAGHGGAMDRAEEEVEKLEAFLAAALPRLPLDAMRLVLTSDHGNLEDLSFGGHTRHPALTVVWGPGAGEAAEALRSLTDVAPLLLRAAGVPWQSPEEPQGRGAAGQEGAPGR